MKFDWDLIAKQVLEAMHGENNIKEFFHCATRLRIIVKDNSLVDKALLEKIDLSKGYNFSSNQWQIIFGTGTVNKVHDALKILVQKNNIKNAQTTSQQSEDQINVQEGENNFVAQRTKLWNINLSFWNNLFNLLRISVRSFADLFIPLIPVIMVGGLSLAISSVLRNPEKGTVAQSFKILFDIMGGAILGSLPVFLGYTTAKKLKANPFLGMAIGLMLVSGTLLNAWSERTDSDWNSLGDPRYLFNYIFGGQFAGIGFFERLGYQAQAIPTIAIVAFFSFLYRYLDKKTPAFINLLVVPIVSCFITLFLGLWFIGPIMRTVSDGISKAFTWIVPGETNPILSGLFMMILGLIYAPIVMTGFHQGFVPFEAQIIADAGGQPSSLITPIATISNIAQGSAALIACILVANKAIKQIGLSGAISAYAGITEPAMFGINLRLLYPFVGAMFGSAIGGLWIGATQTLATSLGSASFIGILVMQWSFVINTGTIAISHGVSQIIGCCITMFVTFAAVFVLHKTKLIKNKVSSVIVKEVAAVPLPTKK